MILIEGFATEYQVPGRSRTEFVLIRFHYGNGWSWQIVRRGVAFIGQIHHPMTYHETAQAAVDAAVAAGVMPWAEEADR